MASSIKIDFEWSGKLSRWCAFARKGGKDSGTYWTLQSVEDKAYLRELDHQFMNKLRQWAKEGEQCGV